MVHASMADTTQQEAEYWLNRITKATKRRDEGWGKDAKAAENTYALRRSDDGTRLPDFNILFSNVETIVPSIFNSMPLPDIRERHKQGDKAARYVADIFERVVSVQTDDSALDEEVEYVARDGEVPGRGILRVRFDADSDEMGNVSNERVRYEAVSWMDYLEGEATRWSQVPWVAFRHQLAKTERDKIYDKEYQKIPNAEDEDEADKADSFVVHEVWCKSKR